MNVAIQGVQQTSAASVASLSTSSQPLTSMDTLPAPVSEAMMTLEGLMLIQQRFMAVDFAHSEKVVERKHRLRKEKLDRMVHEWREAMAAQNKKGGGWLGKLMSDLGPYIKVAAVVASVAFAIGTAGAGTPVAALAIAGATMSTAGFLEGEFGWMEKMGIDSETAGYLETGLELGGAVCSMGAGAAAGGAQAADAGSELASAANTVGRAAQIAQGVTAVGSSVVKARDARYQHEADLHMVAAEWLRLQRQMISMQISKTIDELKESQQRDQRTIKTLMSTIQQRDETPGLVVAKMRV